MRVRSGSLGICLLLVTLSATVMTPTRSSGQAPAADTTPIPTVEPFVPQIVLPNGDRVGSVHKSAGARVSGAWSAAPPPARHIDPVRPRPRPLRQDAASPPSAVAESGRRGVGRLQTGTSLLIKRDTTVAVPPGYASSINEPSVGSQGDAIFQVGNWYGAVSTDNGATFRFIDPSTTFPRTPFAFSAGFCCDQRVAQDPARDLVIWSLLYVQTGSGPTDTNGVRIAVARGAADLSANTWETHDLTPADFGFPLGTWLDYPQIQVSANYLYLTANVFNTGNLFQIGAVIGRIPLAALASGSSYTMDAFVTPLIADIAPVSGATSTMYFGSVTGTGTIEVISWPEASAAPMTTSVGGLAFTTGGTFSCPGPDGLDPCTRGLARMQTGWITTGELGFMWQSGQTFGRPFPFVRVAILNPSTLALLAQPDIWSSSRAYLFPYVAVNARGHLGGTVFALGGDTLPALDLLIRDSFSPDVAANGWELHEAGRSTNGTAGRWGDFSGAVAHERYPNTWIAVGHLQEGGSADSNARPHNFWFMRDQDDPGGPPSGSPTPTRTPEAPTATTTGTPSATTTSTQGPTAVPVGGRGFTLQSGPSGVLLTWQGGQGQTGYVILRFGALPAVLPITGPLLASATTFQDTTAGLLNGPVCYVLVPTGVAPAVVSDLLCAIPNTHLSTGAPLSLAIRLDQSSTAKLIWNAPSTGGQTGFLLYSLSATASSPVVLPGTATSTSVPLTSTSCFLLVALSSTVTVGSGDIVCAVPGISTFALRTTGDISGREALLQPPEPRRQDAHGP